MQENASNFASMGASEHDRILANAQAGMDMQGDASQWKATTGEAFRNIRQQRNDREKNDLDWYANIFNSSRGLPATGGGSKTDVTPGPSLFNQALGAAATGASIWAMSDERAKEDIGIEVGALDQLDGLDRYGYKYKAGLGHTKERTSGLMAQDLERSGITGAVREDERGIKHVDLYPVLATVVQGLNELKREVRSKGLS
jgi:hypothetical protein